MECTHKVTDNNKDDDPFVKDELIIGRFNTHSSSTNGKIKTKNGKELKLYIVKPLDPSLPPFQVPYGGKSTGDLIIKFRFNKWINNIPEGLIGDDGEVFEATEENLERILLNYYNIYPKKSRKLYNNINPLEDTIDRKNYSYINLSDKSIQPLIFSIDPENCEDIDDALSIYNYDNITVVGVHIAQPIYWLTQDDLDEKLKTQCSTYYGKNRIDLFGSKLTLEASLKKGYRRPAYSTSFIFKSTELIDTIHEPTFITNNENYSYDNVIERPEYLLLKEFTDSLIKGDIEDVVSYWMVKTNASIGKLFNDKVPKISIPYRVNTIPLVDDRIVNDELEIQKVFNNRNLEKAEYKLQVSDEEMIHSALGLVNYCHFTSPIRRIVDSYIHYYLTYGNLTNSIIDVNHLNTLSENTKKFHRQLDYKRSIETNFTDNEMETDIWIYDIIDLNKVEVYIEKLGVFKKINIYHPKFSYCINETIPQMNNEDICKINMLVSNKEILVPYEFKVGDCIKMKLYKRDDIMPNRMILPFYLINLLDL